MPALTIAAAAAGFFSAALGFMRKLPDYDQKQLSKFTNKLTRFEAEIKRPYPERDDDLILNLRDELTTYLSVFSDDLKKLTGGK